MSLEQGMHRVWYEGEPPPLYLRLLSIVFAALSFLRRLLYRMRILRPVRVGVPVVVVGNIVAGGAGKTPLALALVRLLQARGLQPGIVSRGYGARIGHQPRLVTRESGAGDVGDEPLLLARRTNVPVCVHPKRSRAARYLLEHVPVDVIVCDDGLQHLALARDFEIVVIDGVRGLGNGRLLPAGPLRESARRLETVDWIVINGPSTAHAAQGLSAAARERLSTMKLQPVAWVNVMNGERRALQELRASACVAVAGISNPDRFFATLHELGFSCEMKAFSDHHAFVGSDLAFASGRTLLMTEKDAMKCREFAESDWWYLELDSVLEDGMATRMIERIVARTEKQERIDEHGAA